MEFLFPATFFCNKFKNLDKYDRIVVDPEDGEDGGKGVGSI